ncbi:alpha/beta hydrolase fold domain-containing protein [Erythrobacter sp. 3-20A1M]|uniref:alpha/beta hydrolase fold domain-containing protein n=1 Tax=Erythrobacter sp. 3-20A1M TaxID=2653850 RepID=UPI001BFC51E2|nr:alpha/beta hydrolase fold domain-containing protein [Erythrobacter sp. 3-20A1M]QWC57675.1 alpha/beta hydrolase fold domain-containing protein [Erythrobacter sp. 3-20A1M]
METIDTRRAAPLDPDIARFLEQMAQDNAARGASDTLPMVERRAIAEDVRERWRLGGPQMAQTRELDADGVRLRLYRPVDKPGLPVLFYIHGGGWQLFSIETHDRLMREYAARAQIAVVGVDYSLAPEHRFPVALEEIATALAWLEREGEALGLDTGRIAIGGDSAGANLSVSSCLLRRAKGNAPLAAMLLNYGAYDPQPTGSYARYGEPPYPLEIAEMDAYWRGYVADADDLTNPLVAPALADLRDLPPAFFAIAECDILADSNYALAARMAAAGGEVTERTYRGATHSFLEAMSIAAIANTALDEASAWLRERLDRANVGRDA